MTEDTRASNIQANTDRQAFDPTRRFSDRVDVYRRFRPQYPAELLMLLERQCGLTAKSIIADVGAGTGLLTKLFLRNGNAVTAIEPNAAMRGAVSDLCEEYPRLSVREATAEVTGLDPHSFDFVTAGTAFHWFELDPARREFGRILKPRGWVVIVANHRRADPEPFVTGYEQLLERFGKDYLRVQRLHDAGREQSLFAPGGCRVAVLANHQDLDLEGLEGRILSASSMPLPEEADYPALHEEIVRLFERHQRQGQIRINYDCRVSYGQLDS